MYVQVLNQCSWCMYSSFVLLFSLALSNLACLSINVGTLLAPQNLKYEFWVTMLSCYETMNLHYRITDLFLQITNLINHGSIMLEFRYFSLFLKSLYLVLLVGCCSVHIAGFWKNYFLLFVFLRVWLQVLGCTKFLLLVTFPVVQLFSLGALPIQVNQLPNIAVILLYGSKQRIQLYIKFFFLFSLSFSFSIRGM